MKRGTIQLGWLVLLKPARAEAFGITEGPYKVLEVRPDRNGYKREWVALEGLDDGQGGQGVVRETDIACRVVLECNFHMRKV